MSTGLDFASFCAAARPTLLRTTYGVTGDRQLAYADPAGISAETWIWTP